MFIFRLCQGVWRRPKQRKKLEICDIKTEYLFIEKGFKKKLKNSYTNCRNQYKLQLLQRPLFSTDKTCLLWEDSPGWFSCYKNMKCPTYQEKPQSLKSSKSRQEKGKAALRSLGTSLMSVTDWRTSPALQWWSAGSNSPTGVKLHLLEICHSLDSSA